MERWPLLLQTSSPCSKQDEREEWHAAPSFPVSFPRNSFRRLCFLDLIGQDLVPEPCLIAKAAEKVGNKSNLIVEARHLLSQDWRHREAKGRWTTGGQHTDSLAPPTLCRFTHSLLLNFILGAFSIFLHLSSLPSTSPWKMNFHTVLLSLHLPTRVK